jgi:hypothetical protein
MNSPGHYTSYGTRPDLQADLQNYDERPEIVVQPAGSGELVEGGASDMVVPPQPQTLRRHYSTGSQTNRIYWTVDARKLKGNDKQAVSPPFDLSFGSQFPNVTFKMMLYPKVVNDAKGGASFKKARGKGFVQVKCEAELEQTMANVRFRIGIGREGNCGRAQSHNFAQSAVCGLPKDQEEFDFNEAVDKDSQTFLVKLEIVPQYQ